MRGCHRPFSYKLAFYSYKKPENTDLSEDLRAFRQVHAVRAWETSFLRANLISIRQNVRKTNLYM